MAHVNGIEYIYPRPAAFPSTIVYTVIGWHIFIAGDFNIYFNHH